MGNRRRFINWGSCVIFIFLEFLVLISMNLVRVVVWLMVWFKLFLFGF